MAIVAGARGELRNRHAPSEYALDGLTVDSLAFPTRSITHCAMCDAVDVAKRARGMLMHQCYGVGCKDAFLGACERKPMCDVFADIITGGIVDRESMVDA